MDSVAHVRIFAAGEFTAPPDWPDDVGVAVIHADGIEVFPVHARESGADVLRRIAPLTERDLRDATVYPVVAGQPASDLSFSAVAELRSAVEDFLSRFPQAVEEADDFAVNFGFAADEGIALPALIGPSQPAARADPSTVQETRANPLPGYVPLSAVPALPSPYPCAMLRVKADGGLTVLLDPDLPALSAADLPVLLREDGMGFAVPMDALPPEIAALRLPAGCMGWIPKGVEGEIPLWTVERGGFLIVSFLPEWAWVTGQDAGSTARTEVDQDLERDGDDGTLRRRFGQFWTAFRGRLRKPLAGLALLAAAGVGAGIGAEGFGDAQSETGVPPVALDALRAGLFD